MADYLCISVTFLEPRFHGRADADQLEWPPSPLRLFQALVSAAAGHWNERRRIVTARPALEWLEAQPAPELIAARATQSNSACQFFVPDNTADLCVAAWKKGNIKKEPKRTEKVVRPTHIAGDTVYYLYALSEIPNPHLDVLVKTARSMTHLGWGIDMIVADARVVSAENAAALRNDEYERWNPNPVGGNPLRVPTSKTLSALIQRHDAFLDRLAGDNFNLVPPLPRSAFRICGFRRSDEPAPHPHCVFELRCPDGSWFRYPPRKLMHIAGMVRHLAIEAARRDPPRGVDAGWAESYVAGHAHANALVHHQLSYLPLQSIGHPHTDPGVRRVMIVAPVGDDALLDHIAQRLEGQQLKPENGAEFAGDESPLLKRITGDNVTKCYTGRGNIWASVTPVILPGHDDHKPAKTRRLIEKALAHSGIEQPCEYEWSAFSRFPQSLSAHKYDKNKKPAGYLRPDHLLTQTAVHLTLRFRDGLQSPGPLAIGAGRHCGLGVFARID